MLRCAHSVQETLGHWRLLEARCAVHVERPVVLQSGFSDLQSGCSCTNAFGSATVS